MPIKCRSRMVLFSRGKVANTEIDTKNKMKNEMPPIDGLTVLDHRTWPGVMFSRVPKLNEKRRNSQLMRNEKKVLMHKNSIRKNNEYASISITLLYG